MIVKLPIRIFVGLSLALVLSGCQGLQQKEAAQQKDTQQTVTSGDIPEYGSNSASESDYRAVLLSNNMVLFGKLHGLGSPFPVLTDVFYVQSVQDPKTQKPTNVLIKRGKEWHGPDRTVLNANQILIVEPVAKDSKVMQVITEADKQN